MSNQDLTQTVAQMVADDAALAVVFQQFGIDFCCHGDVLLEDACAERELDPEAVRSELQRVVERRGAAAPRSLRSLSTAELIEHITTKHHAYLSETMSPLSFLAAKVAHVHGDRNPQLVELAQVIADFSRVITEHLEKEESSLFPALLQDQPDPAVIRSELRTMFEEHVEVGRTFGRLRSLSDGFEVPAWGCRSYQALMTELEALETDTLEHVHIENHILMPRFERVLSHRETSHGGAAPPRTGG